MRRSRERKYERRVPDRELAFLISLLRHGFRHARSRRGSKLKRALGYVIPADNRDDMGGIDFWVKPPKCHDVIPIQVTQRRVRLQRRHASPNADLRLIVSASENRIREKRKRCRASKVVFVLVADFGGQVPNDRVMESDIRALRYALKHEWKRMSRL